jgi:fluoride ion exporter CrcB/FEX
MSISPPPYFESPDIQGSFVVQMPSHLTLSPRQFLYALSFVAAGGGIGTLLRDLLVKLDPTKVLTQAGGYGSISWVHEIPWMLLAINTVGVFVATDLLHRRLHHRDPNSPLRLLMITGFLGGLTSYSGLFVNLATLWHLSIGGCLLTAVGAILAGVFAGWLGLGRKRRRV